MRKRARPASVAEGGAEFMAEPAAPEIFVLLLEQLLTRCVSSIKSLSRPGKPGRGH